MCHVPELGDLVQALECVRSNGGTRDAACVLHWSLGKDAIRFVDILNRVESGLASAQDAALLECEFESVLQSHAKHYRKEVEQTLFPVSFRWFWMASPSDVHASHAWLKEWQASYDEVAAYKAACFAEGNLAIH